MNEERKKAKELVGEERGEGKREIKRSNEERKGEERRKKHKKTEEKKEKGRRYSYVLWYGSVLLMQALEKTLYRDFYGNSTQVIKNQIESTRKIEAKQIFLTSKIVFFVFFFFSFK